MRRFPFKIALRLKKVCYKVSLCENCQRQSCDAFIGLTNCAKIIGGRRRLVVAFYVVAFYVFAWKRNFSSSECRTF